MIEELHNFYFKKEEPVRSCLLALRTLILDQDMNITETRKYGMPCFCYRGKHFCYLWTDKNTGEPYVLMVEGKYLEDPELEQGSRSRMKILRVNSKTDLHFKTIVRILQSSLDLYRKGIVKIK
ncbi:DUF1801 domain-containing protein [Pedobacter sp. SYSU D00535]|uniref:DUF1801 domain-containing protein n=1 Tax=Pedobacter sp. SYSU D00535 TaxID=2810308 RepID=UPI001A961C7B|nr:DUF1801 domain-containing protein [Pedobacter sp. SYSU D00535]